MTKTAISFGLILTLNLQTNHPLKGSGEKHLNPRSRSPKHQKSNIITSNPKETRHWAKFMSCLLQRWNSLEFDILQERNKVRKRKRREGERRKNFLAIFLKGAIPSIYRLPLIIGNTYHQIRKTACTCFKIPRLKFKFVSLWAAGNWQFYTPIVLKIYVKAAVKWNRGASPSDNTKHKLVNKNAAEADLLWVI